MALAVTITGGLGWWYHRAVLAGRATPARSEVTRIHEYLLSGISLGAASTGVALLVVALLDAAVPIGAELVSGPVLNEVMAAITLLVVGGPLWWVFWRRIQRARAVDPAEVLAPSRRVYLVLLFGVAGVVAVIVVLVAVFLVLNDALRGSLGASTVQQSPATARDAGRDGHRLGVPLDGPARGPRDGTGPRSPASAPRRVLLVGPRDDVLAAEIHRVTGARVEGWPAEGPAWDGPAVLSALAPVDAPQVLVLSGPDGLGWSAHPDAGQRGDQPGDGGEQGQAQLDEHAQTGGLEGEPGGGAGGDGVVQP